MELPISPKTTIFGKRPHVKKGYYPAMLISIQERLDAEGKPFEGRYGRQLIMDFAVYQPGKNNEPTNSVMVEIEREGQTWETELVLPKFVYHMYKDSKTKELRTAVTPNAMITKIFKALGWVFPAVEPEKAKLNVDDFIGSWAELNIDDFEAEDQDGKKYKASTVKDINPYEGPTPRKEIVEQAEKTAEKQQNKEIKKTLKHGEIKEEKVGVSEEEQKIIDKMQTMREMRDEGTISEEGYKQATEQLNKSLGRLKK